MRKPEEKDTSKSIPIVVLADGETWTEAEDSAVFYVTPEGLEYIDDYGKFRDTMDEDADGSPIAETPTYTACWTIKELLEIAGRYVTEHPEYKDKVVEGQNAKNN